MFFKRTQKRTLQIGMTFAVAIFMSVQLFGFTFWVPAVSATGVPVVDALAAGQRTTTSVKDYILKVLYAVGLNALMQGVSYMSRKVAYDTATYIGSGFKGQKPLIFTEKWGDYLITTAQDAGATAIDQLGEPFGLDLCGVPDIRLQAQIQVGLRSIYDVPDPNLPPGSRPTPTCEWSKLSESWGNPENYRKLGDSALNVFNNALDVKQSDFGITLAAMGKIDRLNAAAKEASTLERLAGNGFKSVTGLVSGNIKTPASVVEEETKALTAKHQGEITYGQISGIYGSGALEILPAAASVFLNTLVSQGLNTILTKGIVPDKPGSGSVGGIADFYASAIVNNKKVVQQAFNYLFSAVPKKQIGNYDILSKFSACPQNAAELNNCVIDEGMHQSIERSKFGDPMTIKEAIDEGLLKANWPLVSPLRIGDNTDLGCYLKGYCYSNLQKLRKLRVFPLGFEIAAFKSDPDNPWTLKEVVEGFNDCIFDADGNVVYSQKKPYCRLIDPNWVIRLPEARCEAFGVGPQLINPESPDRREECLDVSTCISEGPNGECIDEEYYAYCTKEKNTWFIDGKKCPSEFNTCKTYTDSKGAARSYLSRTIDFGECSAQDVGCRVYSLEKKNLDSDSETWVNSGEVNIGLKASGRAQVLYANGSIANFSCPASANGCTALFEAVPGGNGATFIKKTTGKPTVYLKKAPDYLGCYDSNPSQAGIQWPKTSKDLQSIKPAEACSGFAAACIPEETACQLYTPLAGGLDVPGIIGGQFSCSGQCVGYDAFKQERSFFEKEQYPMYFIPSSAQTCSAADVGCEEFTNLEGSGDLSYYSKIKYCEKPDGENEKTFYSWEGDTTSGYVLRVHKLLRIDEGEYKYIIGAKPDLGKETVDDVFPIDSPAYAEDSAKKLKEQYAACNETAYNNLINNSEGGKADPDCRALYDEEGKVFYRLLGNTVTVSLECVRLRRTDATFEVDTDIATKDSCTNKKGVWDDGAGQCNRCMGGGEYNNDSCVYAAITAFGESTSCSPSANKCRKYSGSRGNNIANILNDAFEPVGDQLGQEVADYKATGGAASAIIASEAVQVGLHSLQVNAITLSKNLPEGTINPDVAEFYEVSFWAKGGPLKLTVQVKGGGETYNLTQDVITGQTQPAALGTDWKPYHFGPVRISKNIGAAQLVFFAEPTGANTIYFLDNIQFSRIPDVYYLIKDSWKDSEGRDVPLVCDANPNDAFPGQALGCAAYRYEDAQGVSDIVYATGFEKLCREEAIGCAPFFDSRNTVDMDNSEAAHVFSMECSNTDTPVTKTTECLLKNILGDQIAGGACNIQAGDTSCVVEHISVDSADDVSFIVNGKVTVSTIIIPEDDTSAPIYLSNRAEFKCSAIHQGCQKIAVEDSKIDEKNALSYSYESESYVLNNPDAYLQDAGTGLLCTAKSLGCSAFAAGSATTYFKDPQLTSNKLCEYRSRVNKDGSEISGWFRKDLPDNIPCYESYIEQGGTYGIWSNKSVSQYQGFVGVCTNDYNQCTELVDPADKTGDYPAGKPYYVIFDDEIQSSGGKCNGSVSQKEGCVLFNRTELPEKTYNTAQTYAKSKQKQFELVPAVSSGSSAQNDANTILKVQRNRSCSEWLSCKTSVTKIDDAGQPQKLCYEFKACDELENGNCTNWVDSEKDREKITDKFYVERDASWFGEDYTGYSLFNKYQITHYDYIKVDNVPYVVYKLQNDVFPDQKAKEDYGCSEGSVKEKANWEKCGYDSGGRCVEGECVYPIEGVFPANIGANEKEINATVANILGNNTQCKVFPEVDAPFPQTVLLKDGPKLNSGNDKKTRNTFPQKENGFGKANVCQSLEDCSCEYIKVEYTGVQDVDYWPTISTSYIPTGVCTGTGLSEGAPCTEDSHCGAGGSCGQKRVQETHLGMSGYCLEYDISRRINGFDEKTKKIQYPCLTWLPIDVNPSGVDSYDLESSAGYDLNLDAISYDKDGAKEQIGGTVYCRRSTATGAFQHEKYYGSLYPNISKYFSDSKDPICSSSICGESQLIGSTLQYSCNDDGLNGYAAAACANGEISEFKSMNDAITSWAASDFGLEKSNLVILRNEIGGEHSVPAESGATKVYPSKLLSIDIWDGGKSDKEMDIGCTGGYMRGGTEGKLIMRHPPRLWDKEKEFKDKKSVPVKYFTLSPNVHIYNQEHEYWQMERSCSYLNKQVSVSGVSNYPGPLFTDNSGISKLDKRVYRSPFELVMDLKQLKKVYFIPTLFPYGVEGNTPLLLSKNLFIDFEKINNTLDSGLKYSQEQEIVPSFPDPSVLDKNFEYSGQDKELLYKKESDSGIIKTTLAVSYVLTEDNVDMEALNKEYYNQVANDSDFDFSKAAKSAQQKSDDNFISRRYILLYYDTASGKRHLNWIKDNMADNKYILANPFENVESWQKDSEGAYGQQYYDMRCDKRKAFPYFEDNEDKSYGSDSEEGEFGNNNWFAIGLDFNSKGKFLGYVSRFCNQTNNVNGEDGAINMAVLAEIKDQCTDFVQVYDPLLDVEVSKGVSSNKAWTDKVWSFAKKIAKETTRNNPDLPLRPFGTLKLSSSEITKPFTALIDYFFVVPMKDGYPLACMQPILSGFSGSYEYGCSGLTVFNTHDDLEKVNYDLGQMYSTGSDFETTFSSANNMLYGLFAKTYRVIQRGNEYELKKEKTGVFSKWSGDNSEWNDSNDEATSKNIVNGIIEDRSGENNNISLIPPQIYSLNPYTCFKDAEKDCTAAEPNNITINGRNGTLENYDGQPGADEDPFGIGANQAIIVQKTVGAVLNFFGFADYNRMPIKRVMVNWDDGDYTNPDTFGRYKNRKPFCDSGDGSADVGICTTKEGVQSQLTCNGEGQGSCPVGYECKKDTVPHFGNAPRACQENYFEFVHSYTCPSKYQQNIGADSNELATLRAKNGNLAFNVLSPEVRKLLEDRNLKLTDKVCVFKPKVQILDNWGWCNGSCNGEGNTGCYNDGVDFEKKPEPNCDPKFNLEISTKPWTEYNGLIVVIPKQPIPAQAQ